MIKAGDVIQKKDVLHVVTDLQNGEIVKTMPLEDFVSYNVMVNYEGEMMTLQSVIAKRSDEYIQNRTIHKV